MKKVFISLIIFTLLIMDTSYKVNADFPFFQYEIVDPGETYTIYSLGGTISISCVQVDCFDSSYIVYYDGIQNKGNYYEIPLGFPYHSLVINNIGNYAIVISVEFIIQANLVYLPFVIMPPGK